MKLKKKWIGVAMLAAVPIGLLAVFTVSAGWKALLVTLAVFAGSVVLMAWTLIAVSLMDP